MLKMMMAAQLAPPMMKIGFSLNFLLQLLQLPLPQAPLHLHHRHPHRLLRRSQGHHCDPSSCGCDDHGDDHCDEGDDDGDAAADDHCYHLCSALLGSPLRHYRYSLDYGVDDGDGDEHQRHGLHSILQLPQLLCSLGWESPDEHWFRPVDHLTLLSPEPDRA